MGKYVELLKSKLHRACITEASVEYPGSIGISRSLMDASGLLPWEKVLVANITNGERLETYVIEEEREGQIILNGAAAHKGSPGDRVIIMSFCEMEEAEAASHKPTVVVLDENNNIISGG